MASSDPNLSGKRMDSLPARPLSDTDLSGISDADGITTVWVPAERPESVQQPPTGAEYDGDILKIWLEFEDKYVALSYGPGEDGPSWGWHMHVPVHKDESIEAEAMEMTLEEYQPLSERL